MDNKIIELITTMNECLNDLEEDINSLIKLLIKNYNYRNYNKKNKDDSDKRNNFNSFIIVNSYGSSSG